MINDGQNQYRYDTTNKLAEIRTTSGLQRWFHDALSRLASFESPTGNLDFIYDDLQLIEWRKNGIIEGQAIPLDRPHQYAHLASNGKDSSPMFDIMDSIVGWIDSNSNIIGQSTYDPFGQVLERSSSWPAPLGFAGYWYEPLSETYELTARSYNP